jgi:hypothetical protein
MKTSFVFYSGWYESAKKLPPEVRDELFLAIMEYGLLGKEPEKLCTAAENIWSCIKPQMYANQMKYNRTCSNTSFNNKSCRESINAPKAVTAEQEREKERSKEKEKEDEHEHEHEHGHEHEENKKLNSESLAKKTPFSLAPSLDEKNLKVAEQLQQRAEAFYDTLVPYVRIYGRVMVRGFYDYWTEPNPAGTKMRFELQKTWSLERRLKSWGVMPTTRRSIQTSLLFAFLAKSRP